MKQGVDERKQKVLYIVPGHTENATFPSYQKILKIAQGLSINAEIMPINWRDNGQKSFIDFRNQVLIHMKGSTDENKEVVLLGFSFGAISCFLASKIVKPHAVILCSPSPYFKEDYTNLKPEWLERFLKNRKKYTRDLVFEKEIIHYSWDIRTYIMYGENESQALLKRSYEMNKFIPKSTLIKVKEAAHDLNHKNYQQEIKNILNEILI